MVLVGANKIHYQSNIIAGEGIGAATKSLIAGGRNSSCYKSSYD